MFYRYALLAVLCLFAAPSLSAAQDQLDIPVEVREWFRNFGPGGSCVQCATSLCGVWQNCPQASTLLWDTDYGPKVHGGSYPSRVEAYCDARKIPAYNVTGSNTWDWMKWAAKTGRFAAIGAGSNHFQCLVWHNPADGLWYVNNNNSPSRIDKYDEAAFRRLHLASGQWVVILKTPPPAPVPEVTKWWD